ncbi:asparaginyl-tRNA synthetase [Salpingoeca rosetta]|uniref:asparagine--tRNA ligase n=1 Tax=Salpingoeca rosetta (strain ATCC 50818 / BSB-021) TaxID=946362 RepID=F2U8W5_SALR5|nr:asparaginyl-tRNA synthetase [Salpingoeca rosetta]EGD73168.1 asparaginyl-tRNA synthetase [Salpingoeca rosetta]|eukprot:XP_004994199.1 asparaginyl-tRNA synthetase [Salpingoeca rosetta]
MSARWWRTGAATIRRLLQTTEPGHNNTVVARGWLKSLRRQKRVAFAALTDGTTARPLQVVLSPETAEHLNVGSAVEVSGTLAESPGKGQALELQAANVSVIGDCDTASYPVQGRDASAEFLRTIPHMRMRTSTLAAALRVRSCLTQLTHRIFAEWDFASVHTPILTSNDCEGGGDVFSVTAPHHHHRHSESSQPSDGTSDSTGTGGRLRSNRNSGNSGNGSEADDAAAVTTAGLFSRPFHLTVSGQLHAEAIACGAYPRVYTFGPTFRAENSHTPRHLAEFYMLEAEMAFASLDDCLDLQDDFISAAAAQLMHAAGDDLDMLWSKEPATRERVQALAKGSYERITYTEAVKALEEHHAKTAFTLAPCWGRDLAYEHEQFIANMCEGPVFITNYPKAIKPFYMLQDDSPPSQGATVAAADLIVPGIGELTGGSAREHRLDHLHANITEQLGAAAAADLEWYLDLRRFGSVPHAGFGLGFERLLLAVTGLKNVRDVIPFPRHPGVCYL